MVRGIRNAVNADPEALAPSAWREVRMSIRLHKADVDILRVLAKRANVGPSTMARLVVERYIADHAPKGKAP